MNCRRCKKAFEPKHQEARCSSCLEERKSNRVAKRRQARDEEKTLNTFRQIMVSNGDKKGSSKVIGMLH